MSVGGFPSLAAQTGLSAVGVATLFFGFQYALDAIYLERLLGSAEVADRDVAIHYGVLCCFAVVLAMAVLLNMATFLPWFWRAYSNLRALGIEPTYGRHWVVTGFLVPGVNLVQPYHVALEIWQRSDRVRMLHADPSEPQRPTGIVTGWWICLLTWTVGTGVVLYLRRNIESNEALIASEIALAALSLIGAVAAALGLVMIGRVDRLQAEAYGVIRWDHGAASDLMEQGGAPGREGEDG